MAGLRLLLLSLGCSFMETRDSSLQRGTHRCCLQLRTEVIPGGPKGVKNKTRTLFSVKGRIMMSRGVLLVTPVCQGRIFLTQGRFLCGPRPFKGYRAVATAPSE